MDHVDHVLDASAPARPPVASFVVPSDEPRELTTLDRLATTPGPVFHIVCGLGALGALWSAASPAGLRPGDPFAWLAFACLAVWAIRSALAASRHTLTAAVLIAPALAGVVGAAQYLDVPAEARWMQAQSGFENTLRALPETKHWDQKVADEITPERIGSYAIADVTRDSAGMVQFHLGNGMFGAARDSGSAFTYLVDGPTEKVRAANPGATFAHLHGNWYIVRG